MTKTLVVCCILGIILPSFKGIIIRYCKDPYWMNQDLMECHKDSRCSSLVDLGLTSHPGRSQCLCLPCSCAVYDGHKHSLWGFSNGNLSAVNPAIWFFIHLYRLYGLISRSFPSFLWMVLLHWWEYDAGMQESLRTEEDFCFQFWKRSHGASL